MKITALYLAITTRVFDEDESSVFSNNDSRV
jgi:hypothetical protein